MPVRRDEDDRRLPAGLTKALVVAAPGIESAELLRELTNCWGGPAKLAADIHQEYNNAKSGSMTRQRILEMFQRLIVTTTEREHYRAVKPSDLSDEDLQATALGLLLKVQDDVGGGREEAVGPDQADDPGPAAQTGAGAVSEDDL